MSVFSGVIQNVGFFLPTLCVTTIEAAKAFKEASVISPVDWHKRKNFMTF